jgi:hypothetical protein
MQSSLRTIGGFLLAEYQRWSSPERFQGCLTQFAIHGEAHYYTFSRRWNNAAPGSNRREGERFLFWN